MYWTTAMHWTRRRALRMNMGNRMDIGHVPARARRRAAVGVVALGLLAGSIGTAAATASAATRAKQSGVITNFARYVGGHGKANPKLAPVYVGDVNQRTSTAALAPTFTTGTKLAERFINQHAGGIDGHPLELVFCAIPTTVGSAAKCGQEFADNAKIAAVVAGPIDVGNTALESALEPSKKPTFFGISLSTVDNRDNDGYILYGTGTSIAAPQAVFAKKSLKAKSVSITYPSNEPAQVAGANIVYAALEHEGIKKVYKVGFTSSDTNLTEPFDAAHVATTTLLISYNSGGPVCSDIYLTMKSLGLTHKKVLVNAPCDTPTIAKADGGALPLGWYYNVVFREYSTPTVESFLEIAKEYGVTAPAASPFTKAGFGQLLTIAKFETKILRSGKKLTPARVTAATKTYKGPVVMGAPTLHCGGFPTTGPAVCNDKDRLYQNTAPGVMKQIASWTGPPKGFKHPATA